MSCIQNAIRTERVSRDLQVAAVAVIALEVRPARLHHARHTAATMLLVLKIPTRAVMDVMGWSQASMTTRYQHVPKGGIGRHRDADGRTPLGGG